MGKGKKGEEEIMEGIASIALLPSGSISGHFIKLPESCCYGLHGTGIKSHLISFFFFFLEKLSVSGLGVFIQLIVAL